MEDPTAAPGPSSSDVTRFSRTRDIPSSTTVIFSIGTSRRRSPGVWADSLLNTGWTSRARRSRRSRPTRTASITETSSTRSTSRNISRNNSSRMMISGSRSSRSRAPRRSGSDHRPSSSGRSSSSTISSRSKCIPNIRPSPDTSTSLVFSTRTMSRFPSGPIKRAKRERLIFSS
ncbi:MAG: hypothetical protein AMS19_02625 [Gemmatimonas sp. SG8_23]|nr:MAG: hypothetical protein AMS19_02625 [Gemmatimonas sp. SG8_23]